MRKIAIILVFLMILGTIVISGCTQTQPGQNTSSNNTTVKNNTTQSPETLGGEQREAPNSTGEQNEPQG